MPMNDFSQYLSTHAPAVIRGSGQVPEAMQTVDWAMKMFATYSRECTLQVMRDERENLTVKEMREPASVPDGELRRKLRDSIVYLDAEDTDTVRACLDGITHGLALHGRLELFNVSSGKLRYRANIAWAYEFFMKHFAKEMQRRHPLGFHAVSTLWLSSGGHVYGAHIDLQDAFLVHLAGAKTLRVWPTPDAYLHQHLACYEDLEGRMASEPEQYTLQRGDILFIPAGAAHEVTAGQQETSVSIGFHMGSPYPLRIFCRQLREMAKADCVTLPERMNGIDKNFAYYFEPSAYAANGDTARGTMPDALATALLAELEWHPDYRPGARELLDTWWRKAAAEKSYLIPFPKTWERHLDS